MRIAPGILLSLALLGVLAFVAALLQPDFGGFSAWFYLSGAAFVLTRRDVVHARDDEEPPPPETALRRYGAGLVAWLVVALSRDRFCLLDTIALLALLYVVNIGIVGMRRAPSVTTSCLVALAHFSAPAAYVALLVF